MPETTIATLAEIAANRPAATRVFIRHGLDFCCHGQRSLAEACAEKGIDPRAVVREIDAEQARGQGNEPRWSDQPLDVLVDWIIEHYHAPLRRDLPALVQLARKVERVHADKPTCPRGLADHLAEMLEAVDSHLAKEEQVLFPLIAAGRGSLALMPIKVMMQEHEDHGDSLRRTRALTADLVAPPEACESWRGLYQNLAQLEIELMEHIHLENNVLFPRAVNGSGPEAPL